ncbi:hypothetical protein ACTFIW_008818 [Dictyostelium discoideum]
MFGLAISSDLVKWSFIGLIITPELIKEQRKGVLSILELTSLDDTNSQVCPVRHLATYLRASKGRKKPHSGDSVLIQNERKPLDVNEINIIVLSTLSSSGIDISKFKSHYIRSAMASLLLSNNVPFHVVKKMGRWKSNDTVDTFYYKKIIGEKSGDDTKLVSDDSSSSSSSSLSHVSSRTGNIPRIIEYIFSIIDLKNEINGGSNQQPFLGLYKIHEKTYNEQSDDESSNNVDVRQSTNQYLCS